MARKQQISTGKQGTVLHLISKKRVHTLAVSRIARIREKQRNKRNQNFITRNNRKKTKKKITKLITKPVNILLTQVRESRARMKHKQDNKKQYKRRVGSIPHRGQKIREQTNDSKTHMTKDYIKKINEEENLDWIEPFIGGTKKAPIMKINIDNIETTCCVDTGATRNMMTSKLATQLWGNKINNLRPYPNNRIVEDAQGRPVNVKGFKECEIKIGTHLITKYPIIIYEAEHSELLLGYSFLVDYDLAIYAGKDIHSPQ